MVCICEEFNNADDQLESIRKPLAKLPVPEQLRILSVPFSSYAHEHHNVSIPEDFLKLTVNGSRHLQNPMLSVAWQMGFGVCRMMEVIQDCQLNGSLWECWSTPSISLMLTIYLR